MRDRVVTSSTVATTLAAAATTAETTAPAATTTTATTTRATVRRITVPSTSGQQSKVRKCSPKSPVIEISSNPQICEPSPKPSVSQPSPISSVCELKVGNNSLDIVENCTQNEEKGSHFGNNSVVLEPMENTKSATCFVCEEPGAPLKEISKESWAPLNKTSSESEAPLSETSKEPEAPLSETSRDNGAPLSETTREYEEPLLNVTQSNVAPPTQTPKELATTRDCGQGESDKEAQSNVSNGDSLHNKDDLSGVLMLDDMDAQLTFDGDRITEDREVDPTSQTAMLDTMETEEGNSAPVRKGRTLCESSDLSNSVEISKLGEPVGGSSDPSNSADAETPDGSINENITRNDKETLTPATTDDPDSVPNKVRNRGAPCKWRVQFKNDSPTRAKSRKIKPSQKRVPNTKTCTGKKELGAAPAVSAVKTSSAVSAMKTKKKAQGKNDVKKSVKWSDLTLPDSVQRFFHRNSSDINLGVPSQEKVHLKYDTSSTSKGTSACKNTGRKERKNTSKSKRQRKVQVTSDEGKDCEEVTTAVVETSHVSEEESIPVEASGNVVSPRKRQDETTQGSNKPKKRVKMAAPRASKPETEVLPQAKDKRSPRETGGAWTDENTDGDVAKSTGQGTKEVSDNSEI